MSVADKQLMIVIYLPRERAGSLAELLEMGGLRITAMDENGWVHAKWDAANVSVEVFLQEQPDHRLIWMKFYESSWLEMRPDDTDFCPQSADGGMVLVSAMRDLCMVLKPEVALFFSHLWQDEDWWQNEEWAVLAKSVEHLLSLHAGILYVDSELAGYLYDPGEQLRGREVIPTDEGLMVLSGSGYKRFL